MTDELYTILDRIWLEGHYSGDFTSFDEWLHEDDSRESWLVEQIRKALTEKSEKPTSPWHKASEDLPEEGQHILIAHKMRNGDYMTEAIWYPEPQITDAMDWWMEIPELPIED